MRLIDDGSERNFLNNRCEWPIKSCDLPIMSARPNNANDRKSACAIDERLSRHLPFVQPLAARGQFIGFDWKGSGAPPRSINFGLLRAASSGCSNQWISTDV
jgi:hypothetical protein